MRSFPVEEYHIGIICALPKELRAVKAILDEEHEPLRSKDGQDHNSYILGRVGEHNVVAAGLPAGVYGTTSAASVGRDMLRTFAQLRFGLLVGIAGGIPGSGANRDVRLGDVIVSQPDATYGGVVQYDIGKLLNDGQFVRRGILNKPPQTLLTALTKLQADIRDDSINLCLREVDEKYPLLKEKGYHHQGSLQDQLHCASCDPSQWWWMLWMLFVWLWPFWRCGSCINGRVIRPLRSYTTPVVHYGTIASGNTLLKNATKRDQLAREIGALCVEMEMAGLDDYPCLVIRGICDYSDAYKNDVWQEYAALTAAAYTKVLLGYISPEAAKYEKPVQQVLDQLDRHFQRQHQHNIVMEEHIQRQEMYYHDDRYRDCHRIFGISDYEHQKNINIKAVSGTCRWVLDHPQYHEWFRSTKDNLLWISADPGCGKSVLSRSLVEDWLPSMAPAITVKALDRPFLVCYYFFKDNEEQGNLSTALCAILHQLFSHQPELIRHALPSFDKHKEDRLTKNTEELWRILQSATTDADARPVICVVDALDECRNEDRRVLIARLCQSHRDSMSRSNSPVGLKWLVTSRPHDDIQGYFGRLPQELCSIRLRGEDENDKIRGEIDLVIDQRMSELGCQLGLSNKRVEEVIQQLRKMDNRTYLWLHLVLEDIEAAFKRSARPNQVKVPLLPSTVDQAYENILERIVNAEERYYAKVVLTIIVGSPRPLSLSEMAVAFDVATLPEAPQSSTDLTIAAENLGDKIRIWCGLFVYIKHNQLYLIHQTAKDFLESHGEKVVFVSGSWKHCLHPRDIQRQMAEICVIFLSLSDFNTKLEDTIQSTDESRFKTFFAFAAEHWANYVRMVESDLDDRIQSDICSLYDPASERFRRWRAIMTQTARIGDDGQNDMDEISLASFNGHFRTLQHMLSLQPDRINQVDSSGRTPLCWAARYGNKEFVKFLLNHSGIDVNLGNPLSLAAGNGQEGIVQLLVAHSGIDINLGEAYGKPLASAANSGYSSIVALLLVQPGVDVNFGGIFGEPLARAARNGHKEVVKLLLAQPGIDVNCGEAFGEPLYWAATNGHEKIVEALLAHPGINVNLGEPLTRAADNGHQRVVALLVAQAGIDVNLGQPLSEAAYNGYREIVELFLTHPDIDVNLGESLHWASRKGYVKIAGRLLQHPGIDVNLGAPLSWASRHGHNEIVKLLLAHPNIDVNMDHGRPLTWAAQYGQTEAVKLLLHHPSIDVDLGQPFYQADINGHEEIVDLLLARPVI